MGFAHGLAVGTQVGNSFVNSYRDSRLKRELSDAGNFTPTDVASGDDAHAAGLKARQFQIDQISADDPDYAAKHKQVMDDFAPTMTGLEAAKGKSASQMVQLPGGRRIEQDEAFSPEQMAGLRAEQSSQVYSKLGYPEEAAKSTLTAQGISKNRMGMQKDELDLKSARRRDKQESEWASQDEAFWSMADPNVPADVKEKNVESLARRIGPLITSNNEQFKGVTYKGVENNAKDGMHVVIDQNGEVKKVPLSMDMIQKGYSMLVQSRDPAKYAEFQQRQLVHNTEQAGLDRRAEANNKTQLQVGRENNASSEKVAGIRANAIVSRTGGSGGLSPEDDTARRREISGIIDDVTLTPTQKDDMINRINVKYNWKAPQLREPTKDSVLSISDLHKIHEMVDIPQRGDRDNPEAAIARKRNAANRIHPGAGDQLYDPPAGQAPSGISAASSGPSVGTVKNGFRFKGGNPNVKENWEPA